ncbi:hypothetical protein [Kribbella sp. CA-294648]|uniref:hypothetical protein n=1 Tax=Kribbella sp. CA-294648 TaxID=3239948 RepID=UPI003D8F6EEE
MTRIDELHVLKTLDPAAADIDPHGTRAQADLQRILATEPVLRPVPPRPAPRRKIRRRVALGAGLVAAVSATAIVVPSVVGGDEAFASWTGDPAGMSAKQRADASASCRQQHKVFPEYKDDLSTAVTAISERRGRWTLVVLSGQHRFTALCVTDDSTHWFRDFFGSVGRPTVNPPAPRGLAATDLGTGAIDGRELSVAVGFAGSQVVAVTYTSPTHGKVKATVAGGHFALWLPGNDLEHAARQGAPVQVTYRDGTTARVALRL